MPRRAVPDRLAVALGQRVRHLRQEKHLSQDNISQATGLSKGHLSEVENGWVRVTVHSLAAIARAMNVSLPDLLTVTKDERAVLGELARQMNRAQLDRLLDYAKLLAASHLGLDPAAQQDAAGAVQPPPQPRPVKGPPKV